MEAHQQTPTAPTLSLEAALDWAEQHVTTTLVPADSYAELVLASGRELGGSHHSGIVIEFPSRFFGIEASTPEAV